MRKIIAPVLTISVLIAAPSPYEEGKKLYFSKGCNGCHGVSATGTHEYPSLAYRRKAFLIYKLKNFRAKEGNTQQAELMIPFALALSDTQINAIATFLSEYHETKGIHKNEFTTRGDGGS